ncbi:MAG: HTH domain-containing protein [Polyangiaceae bacterium]
MRRQARLFASAEYLRGRRTGVTAEALAERFGVTIRTIYRDLDSLREAALPLAAERGRGGGYALERSYSLPPVNFSAREAALLIAVGQWFSTMRVVPFTATLESAMDKVRSALSSSSQRELIAQLETLKFLGVPARPSSPEVRRAVEQAWFESLPLEIAYVSKDFIVSVRRVRIITVLMDRFETILECEDLDSAERRPFRLDRIDRATVLPRELATPPQRVASSGESGSRAARPVRAATRARGRASRSRGPR